MKMCRSRNLLGIFILVLILVLVTGCGQPSKMTGGENAPASAEPAKVYNWKMATSWSTGIPLYVEMAQFFADEVKRASNGRLIIEPFPGGAIAPALEVSEAVRTGIAEMGHLWPGYDIGKDATAALVGGYPAIMSSEATIHWIYNGGGYELWHEWRKDKFDLIAFPGGLRPQEIFLHSHKPVRNLEDLKGLKVRTVGAWAEILPKMGASVVSLPGDEVLPALERKVIDATEWATPGENLVMGFHEVANYIIIPGVHQPCAPFEFVINSKKWAELPDDLKAIVESAAKLTTLHSWTALGVQDMGAMEFYAQKGVNIIKMDESVREETIKLGKEWADERSAGNPWFEKILKSQRDFEKGWESVKDNR
ncbi:MAG: TRAP transporter substrate-binding protein DctP [Bacillota bacterium]